MSDVTVSSKEEIIRELDKLNKDQLNEVLQFTRQLSAPKGVPIESLMDFIGRISPEDLEEMARAIEEDRQWVLSLYGLGRETDG